MADPTCGAKLELLEGCGAPETTLNGQKETFCLLSLSLSVSVYVYVCVRVRVCRVDGASLTQFLLTKVWHM